MKWIGQITPLSIIVQVFSACLTGNLDPVKIDGKQKMSKLRTESLDTAFKIVETNYRVAIPLTSALLTYNELL